MIRRATIYTPGNQQRDRRNGVQGWAELEVVQSGLITEVMYIRCGCDAFAQGLFYGGH